MAEVLIFFVAWADLCGVARTLILRRDKVLADAGTNGAVSSNEFSATMKKDVGNKVREHPDTAQRTVFSVTFPDFLFLRISFV